MYSYDDKAEFSASLHQSLLSHDPSEIILICRFDAQETFLTIINVENSCAAYYVCFFGILWLIESSKEHDLFEIEIFCRFTNVFTITFD